MNEVEALIEKYNNGTATKAEIRLVESWYLHYKTPGNNLSHKQIEEEYKLGLANLSKRISKTPVSLWPRIAAAASILLFLSFGAYFLFNRNSIKQQITQNKIHDVAPGTNKAILTLANGKTIVLTNSQAGTLAQQGASDVKKSANGEIVYQKAGDGETPAAIVYNSITIPRGAVYQVVVLPDGTKVWINSASSLRYPIAFAGNERKVELKGEAYFEVAHNPAKPFRVVSNSQTVEVLGTHFNINAYEDESATITTLLAGSVKITHNNEQKILVPGEQASLNATAINVAKANIEEAVAWKNGYFRFVNTPLSVIARQFSRWYNVTVVYDKSVNDQYFNGKITRRANLSRVLKILEEGGVHYTLDGTRLTIEYNNK